MANLADQGVQGRERLAGGMEARGLYRSGENELGLARQRAAEGRQSTALRQQATGQIGDLLLRIAQAQAARQRGAAEQALGTASSLYGQGYG